MLYNSKNLQLAKNLRSNMTKQERILWNILRAGRFYGIKFKRLVPIGDYIADFVSKDNMIVIEIDGGQHNSDENIINDNVRTECFKEKGYKVIRFWNNDINKNISGVYEILKMEFGIK